MEKEPGMQMDQESLNLCKRLESGMQKMENNMTAVLHLLRGNELDDASGMVYQLREIRLQLLVKDQEEKVYKKDMEERRTTDKSTFENKIDLLELKIDERLKKIENWKSKVAGVGIGIGILGGYFLKALFDKIF